MKTNSSLRKLCMLILLPALVFTAASCGTSSPSPEPGSSENSSQTAEPAEVPTECPWSVDANGRRLAGSDTAVVRDGTPKKYFTLSFDDGITQDARIIELLKKYDMPCTFFINTGLFGANWEWVGQAIGNPSVTHIRFTEEEIRSGIYDGFDVESHTLTHPSLKNYDKQPAKIVSETVDNAVKIFELTGIYPTGMAWPGGDTEYTETTMNIVREQTDVGFARAVTATHKYLLPTDWLFWQPTCSILDSPTTYANRFLKSECTEDMLFYVWGHGYELDQANAWSTLEKLLKMMSEAEDVVCVSNAEFYWLFKDETGG